MTADLSWHVKNCDMTKSLYPPHHEVVGWGGIFGFTPSVRLSVRPSILHPVSPLCSTYSSGWIHSYLYILSSNFRRCVACFLQNFKTWIFCNFFKFVTLSWDLTFFFWLGIWCESLVWVIMGQQGVFQNAGVLVRIKIRVKISLGCLPCFFPIMHPVGRWLDCSTAHGATCQGNHRGPCTDLCTKLEKMRNRLETLIVFLAKTTMHTWCKLVLNTSCHVIHTDINPKWHWTIKKIW